MKRLTLLLASMLLLFGCRDSEMPTSPEGTPPSFDIVDAANGSGGNSHFFFLPPMVAAPGYAGIFDPTLSPVVEICEWTGTACVMPLLARYTTTSGTGGERVRLVPEDEHYLVNWVTAPVNLDPSKTYRIRVRVLGYKLGHVDVDVVATAADTKGVDRSKFVPLVRGAALPIKFRIEEEALLAPGDLQRVIQVRQLLNSTDPGAVYESVLADFAHLVQQVGMEEAVRRFEVISAFAFDPVADHEALRRLGIALGGRIYDLDGSMAGGLVASGARGSFANRIQSSSFSLSTSSTPARGTTLIYVNGVNTDPLRTGKGMYGLLKIGEELGWTFDSLDSKHRIRYFYNRSYEYDQTLITRCAQAEATRIFRLMTNPLSLFEDLYYCSTVQDFLEAQIQLQNITSGLDQNSTIQTDAAALAAAIQAELDQDRNVIIVPHSQGNLMTIEALSRITGPRRCIGVLSIASPTSSGWTSEIVKRGVIVQGQSVGDFLLALGRNQSPPFDRRATNVTSQWDDWVALAKLAPPPLGTTLSASITAVGSIQVHDLLESYYKGDNSRQWIKENLVEIQQTLDARCGEQDVDPFSAQLFGRFSNSGWYLFQPVPVEIGFSPLSPILVYPSGAVSFHPDGSFSASVTEQQVDPVTRATLKTRVDSEAGYVTREYNWGRYFLDSHLYVMRSYAVQLTSSTLGRSETTFQQNLLGHIYYQSHSGYALAFAPPGAPRNCVGITTEAGEILKSPVTEGPQTRSLESVTGTYMQFRNTACGVKAHVYWLDFFGARVLYRTLMPGENLSVYTYLTHPWLVTLEPISGPYAGREYRYGIYMPRIGGGFMKVY